MDFNRTFKYVSDLETNLNEFDCEKEALQYHYDSLNDKTNKLLKVSIMEILLFFGIIYPF